MWQTDFGGGAAAQVWPVGDLREHVVDGTPCWCNPKYLEEDGIWVHNSMDGREKFETGERKFS
jgi:hypothetical protein